MDQHALCSPTILTCSEFIRYLGIYTEKPIALRAGEDLKIGYMECFSSDVEMEIQHGWKLMGG